MTKFVLFLNLLFIIYATNAGVSIDTIIETPQGSQRLCSLEAGHEVICFDPNFTSVIKPITAIKEVEVESIIEIMTEDDTVIQLSQDQRLFVPYKWIQADQLSLGDLLLKKDKTFIKIKSICHKQQSTKLRFVAVEEHHNFLATKSSILIHNGIGGATAGFFGGKMLTSVVGHGSIQLISWGIGLFCPPAGIATNIALESALAAPIEALSLKVGLACGVLLGATTGPA